MPCPLCGHDKTYKHGKTSKGSQRYRCLKCKQTFTSTLNTIYQGKWPLKKCASYCSHTAKEQVCVGSVGWAVCPITQELVWFDPLVKKHKWYTMPRYKVCRQMRSLNSELWSFAFKKHSSLSAKRSRSRRLLDSIKPRAVERLDFIWLCGQAYRQISYWASRQYWRQDQLQTMAYWWLGRIWASTA